MMKKRLLKNRIFNKSKLQVLIQTLIINPYKIYYLECLFIFVINLNIGLKCYL